ncbi:MAG: DUF1598 domain-containing protein [Pirellulaceae bacterium]|nr:DUF1598 domain-containing protein [Pirellulaceae bacterium]
MVRFLGKWCALVALVGGGWGTFGDPPARGADPAQIDAHLAAGEFGPALAAATALPEAAARDALLGKIAAAQAAAGARAGSLATTAEIGSDLARERALDQMFGPTGGAARGGGSMADFTQLIDLIETTIAPESWDAVGGPGAVSEFAAGVFVDASGVLRKFDPATDRSLALARTRAAIATAGSDPRRPAVLRKISLTRLEREVQLRAAAGLPPDEAMEALAGLTRIQYVFFYPESGDIVLAGPAGDWHRNAEGRLIDVEKGRPIVQLDDLVTVLRNAWSEDSKFGCSIDPTDAGLAAIRAQIDKWSAGPLRPGQRGKWLEELRSALGKQDIKVWGLNPRSRAAWVIVEADYRMKLVGMGLEEGVPGVESYLDSIELAKGEAPPPMNVLRWWFTLNYNALRATPERDGFALRGPGVKVLSENELLTERGERVATGKSDHLNAKFAQSFTKHFEQLAVKYPVYAELRNLCDLALVAALIRSHDLSGQGDWHLTHFGPEGGYAIPLGAAPAQVDSVINHRVIAEKHVVAGVSGGVRVDPAQYVSREAVQTDEYGTVATERRGSTPREVPRRAWWWD